MRHEGGWQPPAHRWGCWAPTGGKSTAASIGPVPPRAARRGGAGVVRLPGAWGGRAFFVVRGVGGFVVPPPRIKMRGGGMIILLVRAAPMAGALLAPPTWGLGGRYTGGAPGPLPRL